MKYRVPVVMSYWQHIEVEAKDEEEAMNIAFDLFDISKATKGEGEVHKPQSIKEKQ
jgi:hypothetical protein